MTPILTRPVLVLAGGSLVALGVLVYLMYRESRPEGNEERSLQVYCAAALKPPLEAIAAEYAAETGRQIEFAFGDSGHMLAKAELYPGGDLFLPADDSFVKLARERNLVAETVPLCRMRAVVLTRPGNPQRLERFKDLLQPDVTVGIANPDSAAIGAVVRRHLSSLGKWELLKQHLATQFTTVTDSANAVKLGSLEAAIVWDAVAANYPGLAVVRIPELLGAVGRVELAILASSPDRAAARRFARYVAASDRGVPQFQRCGFDDVETGAPWQVSE